MVRDGQRGGGTGPNQPTCWPRNAYAFRLSSHFCMPPRWWLGATLVHIGRKKKKIIISQLPTSSTSASASATSRLPHRSPSYALLPNHQRRHAKTEDNQKFPAPASSGGKSAKSACVVACWVGCGGERGWRRRGRGSNILTFLLHYYSLLSVCVCVCRNSIIEDADGVWKSNSIFFFSINEKKRSLSLSLCHTKASMTCVHEFLVLKKLKIRVFFGQFSLN